MTTRALARACFATAVLLATGASSPAVDQELVVAELWRTDGASEGLALAWVTDAVIDEGGTVWLLDEYSARLSTWEWPIREAPPRSPEMVAGEELRAPVAVASRPEGGIALLDVVRRSILTYGDDASFEAEIPLEDTPFRFPKDLIVLPDGRFVILGGSPGSLAGLWVFSASGTRMTARMEARSVGDERTTVMVAGGVGVLSENRLLVSRAQEPELLAFDLEAWDAEVIDRMDNLFAGQGEDFLTRTNVGAQATFSFNWFFTRPTAFIRLPSGHLLHVVTDQEGDRGIWEIRSANGEQLRRFSVGRGYRPLAATDEGIVLAMHLDPETREQVLVGLRLPPEFRE